MDTVIITIGFFGSMTVLMWMYFRYEALKLKSKSGGAEVEAQKRIEALEAKCEKLQEQVTEAHALLVDERRQLDRKLAAMIPPDSHSAPRKDIGPQTQAR